MTGVLVGADSAELESRARQLGDRTGIDPREFLANPPAGWVIGTTDRVAEQLAALREAGVSRVMCQHLLHDDLDAVALLGEAWP